MPKPIQTYETPDVKVTFDPNLCIHSGNCVRGLPSVFNLKHQPWITPESATAADVEAQIARCPSGALKFFRKSGG